MQYLRSLQNLTSLWLSGKDITDKGLRELQGLTSLRSLDLLDTAVTTLVSPNSSKRCRPARSRDGCEQIIRGAKFHCVVIPSTRQFGSRWRVKKLASVLSPR